MNGSIATPAAKGRLAINVQKQVWIAFGVARRGGAEIRTMDGGGNEMRRVYLGLAVAIAMVASAPLAKADPIIFHATGGFAEFAGYPTISSATEHGGTPSTLAGVETSSTGYPGPDLGTLTFTSGLYIGSSGTPPVFTFASGGSVLIATNTAFAPDQNDPSAFTGAFDTTQAVSCNDISCTKYTFGGYAAGTFSSAFSSALGLGPGVSGKGLFLSGLFNETTNGWSISDIYYTVPEPAPVPEPATAGLLGLGLLVLAAGTVLRKRNARLAA